jgi:carboxypeptidase Taq
MISRPRPDRQGGAPVLVSGSGARCAHHHPHRADDPFNCIYSTIHETGHAAYEQGIAAAYALTPLGRACRWGCMKASRGFYENQLGRSRAFTGLSLRPDDGRSSAISARRPDAFYAAVNRVEPGFIRTEADEVHYNLHIMLRFDLERALIAGDLAVPDLPGGLERPLRGRFRRRGRPAARRRPAGRALVGRACSGISRPMPLGNVYAGCLTRPCAPICPISTRARRGRHPRRPPAGCARGCNSTAGFTARAR